MKYLHQRLNRAAKLCLGAVVLVGAFAGSAARAATITYSGVADNMFTNAASSAFTWRQFDPLDGVLNAVTYKVSGAFDLSISQNAPFAVYPIYNVSKGFTLNGTGLVFKPTGSAPFDGIINVSWPMSTLLQPGVTSTRTVALDFMRVPDFGLAPFIGAGMIDTQLGLSEDSDLCYSQDLYPYGNTYSMSCTQKGSLTVSVTYDYTPVPEPSALWLLGLGLSAAPLLGRRRNAGKNAPVG